MISPMIVEEFGEGFLMRKASFITDYMSTLESNVKRLIEKQFLRSYDLFDQWSDMLVILLTQYIEVKHSSKGVSFGDATVLTYEDVISEYDEDVQKSVAVTLLMRDAIIDSYGTILYESTKARIEDGDYLREVMRYDGFNLMRIEGRDFKISPLIVEEYGMPCARFLYNLCMKITEEQREALYATGKWCSFGTLKMPRQLLVGNFMMSDVLRIIVDNCTKEFYEGYYLTCNPYNGDGIKVTV